MSRDGEMDVLEKSMDVLKELRGGGGDKGEGEDSEASETVEITGVTEGGSLPDVSMGLIPGLDF